MVEQRVCPICQEQHLVTFVEEAGHVRGAAYSVRLPVLACPLSPDSYEYPEGVYDLKARTLGELRDRIESPDPEEIKAFRSLHGLTQRQLEEVLGYGPRRVTEFERGRQCMPTQASRLFRALQRDPSLVAFLEEESEHLPRLDVEIELGSERPEVREARLMREMPRPAVLPFPRAGRRKTVIDVAEHVAAMKRVPERDVA